MVKTDNPKDFIDVNDAMVRLGNNKKLYATLLKKFDGKSMLEDMITKIRSGDSDGSAAQAHTIKGIAANLSLKDLRTQAESVELKIRNGEPKLSSIDISEIEQSLYHTLDAVNNWLEQNQ